jgi:acetyl esterase/lipase
VWSAQERMDYRNSLIQTGLALFTLYKYEKFEGLKMLKDQKDHLLPIDLRLMATFLPHAIVASNSPVLLTSTLFLCYSDYKNGRMKLWLNKLLYMISVVILSRNVIRDYRMRYEFQKALHSLQDKNIKKEDIENVGALSVSRVLKSFFLPQFSYLSIGASSILPMSLQIKKDIRYGNKPRSVMDVIYSNNYSFAGNSDKPIKCLVYIHGGAFIFGDKTFHSVPLHLHFANNDYLVCSITYEFAPDSKLLELIRDTKQAMKFIENNLDFEQFGIENAKNREKLYIIAGESAGGHLVSLHGLTKKSKFYEHPENYLKKEPKICGIIDLYGVKDILDEAENRPNKHELDKIMAEYVLQTNDVEEAKTISPYSIIRNNKSHCHQIFAHSPPKFIIHGNLDHLVPVEDSIQYHQELKKYRSRIKSDVKDGLVILDGAPHVFNLTDSLLSHSLSDACLLFANNCIDKTYLF